MQKTATVVRITPHYWIYAEDEAGFLYGFSLDRLVGYAGEPLEEIGLQPGRHVFLTVAADHYVLSANLSVLQARKG